METPKDSRSPSSSANANPKPMKQPNPARTLVAAALLALGLVLAAPGVRTAEAQFPYGESLISRWDWALYEPIHLNESSVAVYKSIPIYGSNILTKIDLPLHRVALPSTAYVVLYKNYRFQSYRPVAISGNSSSWVTVDFPDLLVAYGDSIQVLVMSAHSEPFVWRSTYGDPSDAGHRLYGIPIVPWPWF